MPQRQISTVLGVFRKVDVTRRDIFCVILCIAQRLAFNNKASIKLYTELDVMRYICLCVHVRVCQDHSCQCDQLKPFLFY